MALDRTFTLELDVNNPKEKKCKDKNGSDATKLTEPSEFKELLEKGEVIGVLYSAPFTEQATASTQQCVVVYVGGTAYKICS